MMRLVWINGRFSWAVIGIIVFLSVSLIGFDLAWRLVQVPLRMLLVYAVLVDLALAFAATGVCLILRRH
jgi:hypothetical protein